MVLTSETRQQTDLAEVGRQPISIVIPCRAEYVGLCRLLAGVVGARESLEAEDIADLKLVVTEACTCFLGGPDWGPDSAADCRVGEPPDSLRVDFVIGPEAWEVTVADAQGRYRIPSDSRCSPTGSGGLGLIIIEALVDAVQHTENENAGSVIRLLKRIPPRSGSASGT
jgi:serine/threonine-protein kinase RsbW